MKSYIFEVDSPSAISLVEEAGDPVIFSHIHGIEIPNAIRFKRFRGEITKTQESSALRVYMSDIDAGRLARADYQLSEVFIRAEKLSAKYSAKTGSRSLDVLHVAAAIECGCTDLASFDERQRKLAKLVGLKLIPSKSQSR
ncbi:MAG: type II toxin-antitoxin system VapC family toxin [Terrimicrobiaceae bacterium]